MNLNIIGIIIRREYLNRVKKKSFLISTFLVPVLMAALCIIPIVVMMNSKDKTKVVGVVDASSIVLPYLEETETLHYLDLSILPLDSIKANMAAMGLDAVLAISPIDSTKSVTADLSSKNPLGMDAVEIIRNRVNSAVEDFRIKSYNIEGLDQILRDVKPDIRLNTYTMDDEGKETISENGVYMVLSMVMGLLLFLFITLFGGMVMSAVIEEKSSRVVEVLISSVKATELMFGKIIGIALVAFTQFLLWIALTFAIVSVAGSFLGPDVMGNISSVTSVASAAGADAAQVEEALAAAQGADGELAVVFSTLRSLPLGKIVTVFILYFLLGYLLYATMFAAVGSAVENEGDSQQLQMPLTIPLMLGYFIAIYSYNAPDSPIAFWGSMIPFTSPIVMLARIPFGVANWEIIVSLVALALTTVVCTWISAKIYKVGILIFGKKSTWKDLWKWFKQK